MAEHSGETVPATERAGHIEDCPRCGAGHARFDRTHMCRRALAVLSNDDGDLSVQVAKHSNKTLRRAAMAVMDHAIGGSPGEIDHEVIDAAMKAAQEATDGS